MRNIRMFNTFATTVIVAGLAVVASSSQTFAQAPSKLSRVLPLVRPDGTTVGQKQDATLPKGTVKLEIDAWALYSYGEGGVMFLLWAPSGQLIRRQFVSFASSLQQKQPVFSI